MQGLWVCARFIMPTAGGKAGIKTVMDWINPKNGLVSGVTAM
jgi:hypothetical protein